MSKYNLAIIGSGAEALLLAQLAQKKGLSVVVLDLETKAGGPLAPTPFQGHSIESFFSNTYTLQNPTPAEQEFLNILTPEKISSDTSLHPLTFEKGQLEPFVGFGDNPPLNMDMVGPLIPVGKRAESPESISFHNVLQESHGIEVLLNTSIVDVLVYNNAITSITLEGKQKILADQYVFTRHPSEIESLFPEGFLSQKTISRISSRVAWACLSLTTLSKTPLIATPALHILYGTQKNPLASLGHTSQIQMAESSSDSLYASSWITFLSHDTQDVSDDGVSALKEMKRQIKRAYPEFFNNLIFEKIALFERAKSPVEAFQGKPGTISEAKNLWIASHHIHSSPHILEASLSVAASVWEELEPLLNKESPSQKNTPSSLGNSETNAQF